MSNWKQDSLTKHVSLVTKGTTPTSIGKQFQDNGINFIKAESITDAGKFISSAFAYIDESTHEILKRSQLQNGDILFSIAGVLGRVAVVNRDILPANTNQAIAIIRLSSNSEIEKDFLKHLLNSEFVKEQIRRINVQAAQANFSLADINRLQIQYPKEPNEQSNIARILSTADAVIEKTQAAIAKYKAIKQGMLQDLFTRGIDLNTNKLRPRYEDAPQLYKESKLGMIPREWEVEKIGKIFRFNQGVQCPVELQKLHQGENEVRFIRIIDLTNEGEPPRYIADPGSQYHINSNDLFMVRYGSPGLVGYGYEGVIANNLFRIISTGELEILNSFYRYYLTSINDKLTALSASTTMPAINFDSLNKLHVIYPQIFEQVEIEKRIKAIDKKLQTEQTYLQKMQSLKKGLMEDLLSGRKQVKVAEEVLTQSEN